MNRLKKELKKNGVKLECDYPWLPYNGIEAVRVNSEKATISTYHVCMGWTTQGISRDLTFKEVKPEAFLIF